MKCCLGLGPGNLQTSFLGRWVGVKSLSWRCVHVGQSSTKLGSLDPVIHPLGSWALISFCRNDISLKPVLPSSLLLECCQHKPGFCRQYGLNIAVFGSGTGGFGVLYGKAGTNGSLRILTWSCASVMYEFCFSLCVSLVLLWWINIQFCIQVRDLVLGGQRGTGHLFLLLSCSIFFQD